MFKGQPYATQQFFDSNGNPLVGGKIYTYAAGTTTPQATYTDSTGNTPNANPVILDSRGEAKIYMDDTLEYYIVVKNSADVQQYTEDYIGQRDHVSIVNDIATLRTIEPTNGRYIDMKYHTNPAWGGGGRFRGVTGVAPGTYTHNNGTIIVVAGGDGSAAWIRDCDIVSIRDFGSAGDGSDEYSKILSAWLYCLSAEKDLYFPAGEYSSGINNMPFKNQDFPATTLLDCKNITIFGDGPATILRSDSVEGADVLNLYSVKNIHIRNVGIRATISGSVAGSNGCSIVGGFDNITVDGLWCYDLGYVDYGTYLDGGKAFTIQTGIPATECGTVKATRIYAKGCVFGADVSIDLVNWATKKHVIDIDIIAEDCFVAAVFSAGAATGPLSEGMTTGIRIVGSSINCQQDVQIVRAHGIYIDMQVITNKSAAARRLNPSSVAWSSTDSTVTTMTCTYAKNSVLRITGDKGECDYGVRIGGSTAGASGINGATEFCDIYLDFGNQSATADFDLVDSGGNSIRSCNLHITTTMASTLPVLLYASANSNTVLWGSQMRLNAPVINGAIGFAYTDGITTYNTIERDSLGLYFKQSGGSSPDIIINGSKNQAGDIKHGIRNDGYMITAGRATATAVATIKGVLPIYTEGNVLYGYVPVYTSYTP